MPHEDDIEIKLTWLEVALGQTLTPCSTSMIQHRITKSDNRILNKKIHWIAKFHTSNLCAWKLYMLTNYGLFDPLWDGNLGRVLILTLRTWLEGT